MSQKQAKRFRAQVRIEEGRAHRKNMLRYYLGFGGLALLFAVIVGVAIWSYIDSNTAPIPSSVTSPADTTNQNQGPVPSAELAQGQDWTMTMELSQGTIVATLYGSLAPQAVSSFIYLAENGWYVNNQADCSRITTASTFEVLQCGASSVDTAATPGYSFGPIENAPTGYDYDGVLYGSYFAGTLAMARMQDNAYSMGNQFFIVYGDTALPEDSVGGYSVIGQVTQGLDIIKNLAALGTQNGTQDGAPAEEVMIKKLTIIPYVVTEDPSEISSSDNLIGGTGTDVNAGD
jgi:peptidyl-prolyl cis-trans isomerase B (cyclophilin B)